MKMLVHVKLAYLNWNGGIKILLHMNTLAEKSGLDTGVCLRNIESFLTSAEVVMNNGLSRYIYNEDVIVLSENMLLSKDLPA